VELLGADNEVHVGQPVEKARPTVLSHAAQDPQDEVGVVLFLALRWPALPMAFCSAASRTLQVFRRRTSHSSSLGTIR
jgi:hypothetical protein